MPLFSSESAFDSSQNTQLTSLNQRLSIIEAYNIGSRLGGLEAVNIAARISALEAIEANNRLLALESIPIPTLASLGGEPVGAESRAKAYVDQRFPPVVTPVTDIRINCGSLIAYTAVDGKVWAADTYFEFGVADASYLGLVGATYDFALFNYSRSGGGGFNYKIPVSNGNYKVELGFSENYHANTNSRKFNVDIEGLRVLTNFDIRAQAGMRYSAIKREFTTTVTDGIVNIQFTPTLDGAQVNNIRVYSV